MGLENVKVCLVAEEAGIRKIMRSLLAVVGFRRIYMGKSAADLYDAIEVESPDLILLGSEFSTIDIQKYIKDIRHGRIGKNPFLPIVSISDNPTIDIFNSIANAGSDDFLAIPLAQSHITKRIDNLIDQRKPFVITSNYIGPDRRKDGAPREGATHIPLVDVPNVLRAKVRGDVDPAIIEQEIKAACDTVDSLRIDRNVDTIIWLTHRILPGFAWATEEPLDPLISDYINDLTEIADDMMNRVISRKYASIRPLCETLVNVAEHLLVHQGSAKKKTLELLPKVGQGIKVGLGDIRGTAGLGSL